MAGEGITIAVARERVDYYLEAEKAVLAGQAVEFSDGRKLTRADLGEIRAGLTYWDEKLRSLGGVRLPAVGRVRRGVYRSR
jgi:hypothetical protein